MSRPKFLAIVIGSSLAFCLIAVLVDMNSAKVDLMPQYKDTLDPLVQITLGAALGLLLGLGAQLLIGLAYFEEVRTFFRGIIGPMNLSKADIWLVSCCVGFGEELLFRGAVQPLLGVWITSVAFVALHGYLNPFNLKLSLYAIYMIVAVALLGYATIWIGLLSAIAAHAIIDVILLRYLSLKLNINPQEETSPG